MDIDETIPMMNSRLKFWTIVGLLAANLVVGVVSLYFLRSVNQRYAVQFENSVPAINSIRTLARELLTIQRLARQLSDAEAVPEGSDLLTQMDDVVAYARAHAGEISRRELFKGTTQAEAIVGLSDEYVGKTEKFRQLMANGDRVQAKQFNLTELRPCFDRYQTALDATAAWLTKEDNQVRSRYVDDSRFFGGLALFVGAWPVLLAGLALLVLGGMIVVLFITIFSPGQNWRRGEPSA